MELPDESWEPWPAAVLSMVVVAVVVVVAGAGLSVHCHSDYNTRIIITAKTSSAVTKAISKNSYACFIISLRNSINSCIPDEYVSYARKICSTILFCMNMMVAYNVNAVIYVNLCVIVQFAECCELGIIIIISCY